MIKRTAAFSRMKRLFRPLPAVEKWPKGTSETVEDLVLLLFTPPNAGSTAIARFLMQSPVVSSFRDANCEGQWLVPGLAEADRWWPEKFVDYRSVASTWAQAAQTKKSKDVRIGCFVEKSPPNMVRHREILKILPNHRVIVSNRDPYANIASQARRYENSHYAGASREDMIAHLCRMWLYRSEFLRKIAVEQSFPVATYETFCRNPMALLSYFGLDPTEHGYSEAAELRVKDYEASVVTDFNAKQISLLSPVEIDMISQELSGQRGLLDFFGYALRKT